jgi:hypothetical protein
MRSELDTAILQCKKRLHMFDARLKESLGAFEVVIHSDLKNIHNHHIFIYGYTPGTHSINSEEDSESLIS